jgi:WD40 repeat protein
MYASNCILNIAIPQIPAVIKEQEESKERQENGIHFENEFEDNVASSVYVVKQTLRTVTVPRTDWKRSITALALLSPVNVSFPYTSKDVLSSSSSCKKYVACAFSDGTITLWAMTKHTATTQTWHWREYIVTGITDDSKDHNNDNVNGQHDSISIADIDGVYYYSEPVGGDENRSSVIQFQLLTASSKGVTCYLYTISTSDCYSACDCDAGSDSDTVTRGFLTRSFSIANHPTCTLKVSTLDNQFILGIGTALPRSNRVHFYTLDIPMQKHQEDREEEREKEHCWKHQGSVMGHLDWISCLDWNFHLLEVVGSETLADTSSCLGNSGFQGGMLASGSQDARIRLWRFHPSVPCSVAECHDDSLIEDGNHGGKNKDANHQSIKEEEEEDDDDDNEDDLLEEGEARMYIYYQNKNGVPMKCAITLEALLIGHEEGVTSVQWRPNSNKPCLLSSSMDRSILIWMEEDMDDLGEMGPSLVTSEGLGNVWIPITRVGTAGGILGGSIGSSLLGFINALWSQNGRQIVGHGFGGAIYFWTTSEQYQSSKSSAAEQRVQSSSLERWRATPGITGHFRECCDISWEVTQGMYLLSAGMDQTCRLWMPLWTTSSDEYGSTQRHRIWKEVGRPQVHGYDLNSVVCIGDVKGEMLHRFVSGADEKEIRAFDAPVQTMKLMDILRGRIEEEAIPDKDQRVDRAFIPSLGLSNRANLADAMEEGSDNVVESGPTSTKLCSLDSKHKNMKPLDQYLPTERDLGVLSLWPEVRKLYGHLTEIVCLASTAGRCITSESQILIASSCKARDVDNAAIRVWNVEQNVCIDVLKVRFFLIMSMLAFLFAWKSSVLPTFSQDGHKSTVASLSFSSDGKFLASAGKDRRVCIWKRNDVLRTNKLFDLCAVVESAHKRIIWSLDFCVTQPSILASGSRDGYVKIWEVTTTNSESEHTVQVKEVFRFEPACKGLKKAEPITALAFAPKEKTIKNSHDGYTHRDAIIAIGMETGLIEVWAVPLDVYSDIKGAEKYNRKPFILCSIPFHDCHIGVVKKLAWRPLEQKENKQQQQQQEFDVFTLASCSADHGIRLYSIKLS